MFLKYFFKDIYTTTYPYTNQKKYFVRIYSNIKIFQDNKIEKPLVKTKENNVIYVNFKKKKRL